MQSLKIQGQKIKVIETWEESDTETYQRIMRESMNPEVTIAHYFALLTNQDVAFILSQANDELERKMYIVTNFIYNQPRLFMELPMPKEILGVKIPSDLGSLTIEQNMMIRGKMIEAKCIEECISWAVAIYLQPFVTKSKFDAKQAKWLETQIRMMRIYDTYQVGFFFLSKLNNSGANGLLLWLLKLMKKVNSMTRWLRKPESMS